MLHPARRSARLVSIPEYSSAPKPYLRVEQGSVPSDKLFLVRRTKHREDTVCFRTVYLVDHTFLSVVIRLNDPAPCQADPPAIPAQRILHMLQVLIRICEQENFQLIFLEIF